MKTIKRRGQATLPSKKDMARSTRQEQLTKVIGAQAIVERLQNVLADIDRLPLPIGKIGCQFLDCLELTDKIRDKVRQKARDLLLKEPGMIPHWHVSEIPQRVLSRDTARVFDALSREDDRLTPERFLEACTTKLGAVRKLLAGQNPEWNADQIEHVLNRVLADLISYEHVAHLARSKDKHPSLSLP
jgi:hypothetical protein